MDGHVVCARNLRAVWKRILFLLFHEGYFVPPLGFPSAAVPTRKTPVGNLRPVPVWYRIWFMRSFAMCRLLLGRFTALKSSLHIWVCWICVSHGLWWQVRIRAFGLRLNDDGLDSHLLRLSNHLFIRKNDHFPFRIISFPAARETVLKQFITVVSNKPNYI